MSSAYIFFWYILPFIIAGAGWGVALYVTRNDPKPPRKQHQANDASPCVKPHDIRRFP